LQLLFRRNFEWRSKIQSIELIDAYEKSSRGYYGGCIGFVGFDGSCNQAIMIRTFLSKNNTLFIKLELEL
jgi:anthranilate synthase component 1